MTRLGLGKYRIPYNALLQLFELGLLHRGELESGPLPADGVELEFGDQRWRLQRKQTNITLLYYRLTPVGNELAQLLQEPPLEEYLQDLKTVLVQGLQIETMMLTPPAGPEPAPVDPAPDPLEPVPGLRCFAHRRSILRNIDQPLPKRFSKCEFFSISLPIIALLAEPG